MVHEIAHELGDLDPANKEKYEANAEATIKALDQLISDVGTDINSDAKFVVFLKCSDFNSLSFSGSCESIF